MMQLLHSPLLWATLTIAAFLIGKWVYQQSGNSAFLPPILTSVVLVITTLELTSTPYDQYMQGGQLLHYWLGPVVVMLAVPLYQFIHTMRQHWQRILLAIVLGSGTTVLCAALMTFYWIGEEEVVRTMLTKSVTTPVAVAVSDQIGGSAVIASALVIATGILGALMIPALLRWARLDRPQAVGLTLGVCAHAIGTGRALELGREEAAYAAMAMTLTATLHAVLIPLVI